MIFEENAARTVQRVAEEKAAVPLSEMKKRAEALDANTGFPFRKALSGDEISFICEVKRASPSKGLIAPDFPYLDIARDYERVGVLVFFCFLVLFWFLCCVEYLAEISNAVKIPVLRKDFTVDEYMIYQAKTLGASAVLLICSILSKEQLSEYLGIAHSLGLSALVEAHDDGEVRTALSVGAGIIGVNNRDLRTFTVDINNSARLRKLVPPEVLFVSESVIKTAADIEALRSNGTNAVLIGETLMRSPDKKAALDELRGHAI